MEERKMKMEQISAGKTGEIRLMEAMIGLCTADALGVPVEFRTREELDRNPVTGMMGYGTYNLPPGTWSDDSSLTSCLADSLRGPLDYLDIMVKFRQWMEDGAYTPYGTAFDVGRTTEEAIRRFIRGMNPLQCGGTGEHDNGNGSLMRILPAAFYIAEKYPDWESHIDEVLEIVHNLSSLTHGHMRSKIACGIYVLIALNILDGTVIRDAVSKGICTAESYYSSHKECAEEFSHYRRLCSPDFQSLSREEIHSSGYVVDTLEASVWCLLTTGSYKECVLKAVNLGEDTDTTAAVCGGIAGMAYGYSEIPKEWIRQLARFEMILDLCCKADREPVLRKRR